MSPADDCQLDPAVVAALYVEHADELRRFLTGVLGNRELAGDAMQSTFVKAMEQGHTARETSLKSWLFRVALNEALVLRRRQAVDRRATDYLAYRAATESGTQKNPETPETIVTHWETVRTVREALLALPSEQQQVVRLRMYQRKTFAEIAEQLNVPLGTALGRMQSALKRLRERLKERSP